MEDFCDLGVGANNHSPLLSYRGPALYEGSIEKKYGEGPGDEQHCDRIQLAIVAHDPGYAETQGQSGAKQNRRLYKSREQTASARTQDDQQRHSHAQDCKDLRSGLAIVHWRPFQKIVPFYADTRSIVP